MHSLFNSLGNRPPAWPIIISVGKFGFSFLKRRLPSTLVVNNLPKCNQEKSVAVAIHLCLFTFGNFMILRVINWAIKLLNRERERDKKNRTHFMMVNECMRFVCCNLIH